MNCPRCKTPIGPLSSPDSIVTCPGCGSRLMTRSAALRSGGASKPGAEAPPPPAPPLSARPAGEPTSGTQPSAPATQPGTKPAAAPAPPTGSDTSRRRKADTKEALAGIEAMLEILQREVRSLREGQAVILAAVEGLRTSVSPDASGSFEGFHEANGPGLAAIRVGQGKTVMVVDDDPLTREAAVAELRRSEVPVRACADGNAALAAIAEEKPDVIVLELGLGGEMGGKDLVNMLKATMEWVDIPIVLWTREAVSSQKEARQIHGADEVVPKSEGAAALVARVINAFRRA